MEPLPHNGYVIHSKSYKDDTSRGNAQHDFCYSHAIFNLIGVCRNLKASRKEPDGEKGSSH